MDITAQKENELALISIKEELEKSNLLLDIGEKLSNTGGWEYDLQSDEIYWTRQMHTIYEVEGDLPAMDLESNLAFFSDPDRKKAKAAIRKCIEEKQPYVLELEILPDSKKKKWVRIFGVPVIKNGEVIMVRGAMMDITKEKENSLELERAKNEAEKAASAKSDFLSVMSHEIRTPLNGIIGIANLLKQRHTNDQAEIINSLSFSADHLLQLINDILDISKIENDKLKLMYTKIDIIGLVRNIKNQFTSLAESKNIKLTSLVDPDIPPKVMGDPTRLSQILNNLISNAVKYTDEGEITITLQQVSVTQKKTIIHFSIRDTGIGIPEELQHTVFDNFSQIQQTTHRNYQGTGLGLAITKRLIELHNSRIFLKSARGRGTEFYFDLEFYIAADTSSSVDLQASPRLSTYENKLGSLKLLLVEDNEINIMVARKQLEYFGIQPDCAKSAREALGYLQSNHYHIIFLDLHMPEMDGYELSELYAGISLMSTSSFLPPIFSVKSV